MHARATALDPMPRGVGAAQQGVLRRGGAVKLVRRGWRAAARRRRWLRHCVVQGLSGRCCFVSGSGCDVRLPGLWHIFRK